MFPWVYVPRRLYPFIFRWTSRLLPRSSYCKQCCNEQWETDVFFSVLDSSGHMSRSGIAGAQGGFILRYSQVLAGMNESSDKPWWGGFTCGPKCSIYLPKLEGLLNPLTFFFFNFYWSRVALQSCDAFCCPERRGVYKYPLFIAFRSHLDHHSGLSKVPCAIRQFKLAVYCTHSIVVYLSIPTSQLIPRTFY